MFSIGWETYGFLESESSNQRNREDLGNEIYTWTQKAIDKGIEKIQQADECELAYYEGYIGGTIATAIAVPVSIEEHIAGLVVSSGVKLIGISAKTIDGVLQLSKAGRVFMETAQDWAKIWYRNKEIPLSQSQIEELKRLLDEGKIDVEESGLVGKTPEGNEFLERVVQGAGSVPSLIRQLIVKPSYKPLRTIWSKQGKTITFIGKWDEVISGQQNGLQKVYEELSQSDLNIYMQSGKFDHPGGFNMLSIDDFSSKKIEYVQKISSGQISNSWTFDEYIWEAYNKPWLESALQRGDDIIIWSDPINSRTGFYKRELDFIQSKASQYGYNYNSGITLGTFSK